MTEPLSSGFGPAQILSLALGSGVTSAIISQALSAWLATRTVRRDAAHTALQAAIALESYAERAAQTLRDWRGVDSMDVADEHEQGHVQDRASFPKFEGFDQRLEWRHVDGKLSARALTFANEIRMAGEYISGAFEFDDDFGIEHMQEQAGLRGSRAIKLAADLRRAYQLPEWDSEHLTWDYIKSLKALYADLLARKTKRAAMQGMTDDLML